MSVWFDNQPGGFTSYGVSTGGVVEDSAFGAGLGYFTEAEYPYEGVQTPLPSPEFRFCRAPSVGRILIHLIAFFDATGNGDGHTGLLTGLVVTGTTVAAHGGFGAQWIELWGADYFKDIVDPGYPVGWDDLDTTPYVTAPPEAVFYIAGVLDWGPYDSFGATPALTSDYAPYTDADTAMANLTACNGGANLAGLMGMGQVLFS